MMRWPVDVPQIFILSIVRQLKGGPSAPRRQVVGTTVGWCAGCTLLGWLLLCAAAPGSKMCHLLHPSAWLLAIVFIYVAVALISISTCTTARSKQKPHEVSFCHLDIDSQRLICHFIRTYGNCNVVHFTL